MASKLEQALALAVQGFYVFPCIPNGKLPAIPWRDNSTRNKKTIEDWWVDPYLGWNQDYNIGIDCGKSGINPVDIDTKEGKQGRKSYDELHAKYGFPKTLTVRTCSGGLHLYYRASGFSNTASVLAKDIDTRGDGGFVVAPGSTIDGKEYKVIRDILVQPLPAWISEALVAHKVDTLQPRAAGKVIVEDQEDDIEDAIAFLKEREPAVEGHGGDHHTFVTFCMLKERGIGMETAIDLMEEHWNPECTPPWEPDNLRKKAMSAWQSAQNATGAKTAIAEFHIPEDMPARRPEPPKPKLPWPSDKQWRGFAQIPPRDWRFGYHALAKQVGMLIAAPGIGKSTWGVSAGLSKASGKDLLGIDPRGIGNVAIMNNEDTLDEIDRRLLAMMAYHGLTPADCCEADVIGGKTRLFTIGRDTPLRVAKRLTDGRLKADMAAALVEWLKKHNIGLLIVDPLSMTHPANENSNEEMLQIGMIYNWIADNANCAIILIHHTRKLPGASSEGHSGNLDSARGASSLGGIIRMASTLDTISIKEARRLGIPDEERYFYIKLEQAKANMSAPMSQPLYYKRHGQIMGETVDNPDGESIGIILPVKFDENTLVKLSSRETKLVQIIEQAAPEYSADGNGVRIIPRIRIKKPFDDYLDHEPGKDHIPVQKTKDEALRKGLIALKTKGRIADYHDTEIHFVLTPPPHDTPLSSIV